MKKSIFLFFAAILCAMTANAYDQAAKDLYFDNSEAKWEKCYVYIGKGDYTSCYDMTRVTGTQYLWQLPANFNGGNSWNGATGWVVCYEKWWSSANESIDKYIWHGDNNVTKKSTSAWDDTKIYKTNGAANATSDGTTKKVYTVTSYAKNNYTVTINTVEGGTLTVKDYDDNAVATGASKIHLTVLKFSATPADGYVLDGVEINDGTNTTTIAAADLATKTHTLTSAVTITPVWRATTSTVTVTATATNGTVTGGGVVEEGTSVTLTATPADGYKFVNWTVGGAEVSTANPYTFIAEEDVTVTANFEETPKVTIYFVNNSDWSKIQAYAWEGTKGANPSWPGADITANKLGEQIGGFDVYSYTVEQGSYGKVIFNNGSAQTKDYVWTDGNYYWNNEAQGFIGGSKADAESKFSVPVEYDYVYFINTNSWAAVNIYTWNSEIATWPGVAMNKEAEQIAGFDVYSHKEVKGTTFGGMKFNEGKDKAETGDLTWQAGKYYAPSKDKWYDTKEAAAEALAAPVVNTYTVVGSSAPLFGEAWATGKVENDMTLVEGTKYELVKTDVSLTVGEIQYKVAVNHAWDEAYPTENAILNISEAGKYTVTFTFDSNTKAVNATAELTEAVVVLPTVGVKGAWDEWATTTTLTGDNTSASATVNIATAGVYEFGLDVDGDFQASGAIIDRTNNSTVVTKNDGNMKLTVDVLGDYTFTWTYETKTLTVSYPVLPIYTVTVEAENGSVDGDGEYTHGEQATLTAEAAEGYEFTCWTSGEDTVSTENPYSFVVTADVALVANFKKSVVTITKSFELTPENVGNRFGRQTISVEDVDLGSIQLVIPGFSTEVTEYAEATLAIGDDETLLTATATYQNDTENNKEIYTAVATSTDGSKIYNFTFNVALPTTQNYELSAMGISATVESEEGLTIYYLKGNAILGEEYVPVEFMLDNTGYAAGTIGEVFAVGEGEAEQEDTSLYGVVLLQDESGNTYRIEFAAEVEQPEVEIVVKEEVNVALYKLTVEVQGTMAIVSAGTEELSFLLTLLQTENHYGDYTNDAFSNIWYGDDQLYAAYGDTHVYAEVDGKAKFVVSFISTPDAEGNVTKYNFALYAGEKPSDPTALDNLNTTVAPIKVIENGQLIIINNGVRYNVQGAVIK